MEGSRRQKRSHGRGFGGEGGLVNEGGGGGGKRG